MVEVEAKRQAIDSSAVPTVSVIIPAYNAAKYIGEALQSVFKQTFTCHETIVVNDGSPDTAELERELEPYAGRITYIKQANRGAAAARNVGIRASRGELLAFLDADDRWLPSFLERQVEFLNSTNADLVYSDALLFGDPALQHRTFMDIQPSRGAVTPESLLTVEVTVLTSAVLARKPPILKVGLFDETIKRGHDFDLWLRLAKISARFAYHPQVLAEHRIVESGLSGDAISQLERTRSVLETIKARGKLTTSEDAALQLNLNRTLAGLALENGKQKLLSKDFAAALDCFKEASHFRWNWKLTLVGLGVKIAPHTLWRIYHRRNGGRGAAESRLGERILLRLSRAPASPEYSGATLSYTVDNALDFPLKTVPALLDRIQDKVILDYGCGPGYQAVAMARRGARSIVGVDINPTWLERARTLAKEHECDDRVSFVDAESFLANSSNREKFDVIFCCGSFEHFADPAQELAHMKSMTRPGGRILITFAEPWLSPHGSHMDNFCKVPYINVLFSERTVMAVRSRFKDDGARRYEDIESGLNKMTLARFERIIRNSGLSIEHQNFFATHSLPLVKKIPFVREFLVSAVTCILAKDGAPIRQQ